MTSFDRLYGIRQEYDFIMSERGYLRAPSRSELSNSYERRLHLMHTESVHTLAQAPHTSIRLYWSVINTLEDLMNA